MTKKQKQLEMPTLEQLENEKRRLQYNIRYRRTLINTVTVLLVVAAISVLVTMLWIPVYRIYGSSMTPTLENGQIVLAVHGSNYDRGDLVSFYYGNKILIKRIIGTPGDLVDIKDNGDVQINGETLEENYVLQKATANEDTEFPIRIADEHWFLLGDNRISSIDSRNSQIGCVSQEQIVGKVILRIWPIKAFEIFD